MFGAYISWFKVLGGTWLELALLGGLGHLHKELRHLR
jgi:hypothetical protein